MLISLFYMTGIIMLLATIGAVYHANNLIRIMVCIELMLVAANTNFVLFSPVPHDITGQAAVFFVFAMAAAEAAIGLALVICKHQERATINPMMYKELKH